MKRLVLLAKSWAGGVRWRKRNAVLPTSATGSAIDASTRSGELAIGRELSTGNREDPQTSSTEWQDGQSEHSPQSFEMDLV